MKFYMFSNVHDFDYLLEHAFSDTHYLLGLVGSVLYYS